MENKYFKSETVEIKRIEIHPARYNPRKISTEARKTLKRSVKKFGIVGGLVVNSRTGNTLVSGHQKLSILDEMYHYDEDTQENDYTLKVEMIDVDEKTEKELNIALNNPNSMGSWDYDALREMIPDIDYKDAGFTEEDLSLIGVDYLFETEEESVISNEFDAVMSEVTEQKAIEKERRQEERKQEKTNEEKIAHAKEVKQQVREQAEEKAKDMEAYVMLSFDNYTAKTEFMTRFGYNPEDKFVKGEEVNERIEIIE